MSRRAFSMRLLRGGLEELRRRYDSIWPDLVEELEAQGVAAVTLLVRDDLIIVTSETIDDDAWERVWSSDVHARWVTLLAPVVETGTDGRFVTTELDEVFHLETVAGLSQEDLDEPIDGPFDEEGLPQLGQLPANDPRLLGGG